MVKVILELPPEILQATKMTPEELKKELAIALFQQGKLSFGKARQLVGMNVWEFHHLLASRGIPVHYDVTDYEQDIETLQELGRL